MPATSMYPRASTGSPPGRPSSPLPSPPPSKSAPSTSPGSTTSSMPSPAPSQSSPAPSSFAAVAVDLDPFQKWVLAIIAGGGSAAVVQAGTVLTRAASTGTTAGLANFVVSTFETLAGVFFSLMAIVVPVLTLVLLAISIAIDVLPRPPCAPKTLPRPCQFAAHELASTPIPHAFRPYNREASIDRWTQPAGTPSRSG